MNTELKVTRKHLEIIRSMKKGIPLLVSLDKRKMIYRIAGKRITAMTAKRLVDLEFITFDEYASKFVLTKLGKSLATDGRGKHDGKRTGRPRTSDKVSRSYRVSPEIHDQIKQLIKEQQTK